jgi:hypothetical protein
LFLTVSGCALWDASSQPEVALFVFASNNGRAIRLLMQILQTENETSDRMKVCLWQCIEDCLYCVCFSFIHNEEICMGILANLMSEKSIAMHLMADETIKLLAKKLLFSQDPGTLIELCR